jgi:four helix bundle protein
MRRSAVSIPSNIAEGNERDSDREACRFFFISKGSAAELATQARIAIEIGAIDAGEGTFLMNESDEIARMLRALIQVRSGERPSRASRLMPRA